MMINNYLTPRQFVVLLLTGLSIQAKAKDIIVITVTTTAHETTIVNATPTVPSPASYTSLSNFRDTVLKVSNEYRNIYDADPLVWNQTLVEYSRKWAERCIWEHSHGPYGENLAFGYSNASSAVAAWGDEGKLYNFGKPTGFTETTGHFTQLVWKATAEVGCAAVNCGYTDDKIRRDGISPRAADGTSRAQGWYVVCEYTPAGNVVGDQNSYFRKNVSPMNASRASSTTVSIPTSTTNTASVSQPSGAAVINPPLGLALCVMLLAFAVNGLEMGLYS